MKKWYESRENQKFMGVFAVGVLLTAFLFLAGLKWIPEALLWAMGLAVSVIVAGVGEILIALGISMGLAAAISLALESADGPAHDWSDQVVSVCACLIVAFIGLCFMLYLMSRVLPADVPISVPIMIAACAILTVPTVLWPREVGEMVRDIKDAFLRNLAAALVQYRNSVRAQRRAAGTKRSRPRKRRPSSRKRRAPAR